MLDFLSAIADSLGVFLQFISNSVLGIFQLFSLAGHAFLWLNVAFGYIPSVLCGFAITGIFITILFHLIGR